MTTSNSNKSSRIFIKVLFPVLFFVFGVHIQAQDLIFGQSDIINYDNAAEASVLKEDISKGIKIEQIGTQGVIGSPSYIQLNNSNTSPVLNNTSNDALTISCTSTDIDHVIVTYAANSGSTQPYVGYSNIISSMGSTSVNITSCIQADPVGVTQTEVTYACPNNTRFFLMVRNKACAPNTANSTTVRISNIQVFLKSPTCTTPTTQVGAVLFSGVRDTQMAVNLSSYGSGDHILLVAKSGSAVDANPIDGTSYTANASFGTGTEIGTGNYVVYSGPLSGLPITVTGLSPVTSYHFAAYAYNTCSGSPRYKTDDKSINSQTTTAAVPKINIAYYGTSNTALYNYLNSVADFNVTIVTSANLGTSKSSIESYLIANNYDVLFISEEFESTNATTVACEGLNFPVVNGKQFAYKSEVWNWATASNGSSNVETLTVTNPAHPLFNGLTFSDNNVMLLSGSNTKGIGYVTDNLGNMPAGVITLGYSEGTTSKIAIQEIPASVFGSKYIMIAINELSYNALTANGKLLYENAIRYVANTTCTTPTTQVGSISFSGVRDTQMAVNLSSYGSGDHILLVAKSGSAVDANPVDGTSYTANASFGTGTEIGTGNYVVYSGPLSGLPITVTGLSPLTSYHFAAYAYNTCSGSPRYKTDDKSINSQTTTAAVPKINIAYYGTSNTALYTYLNSVADFNVTIVTSANLGTRKSSIESYLTANNYDVLFISEEFESTNATTVACEGLNFPVVNGKQFAYKSEVWNWATASNGSSNVETLTVANPAHPIFSGLAFSGNNVTLLSGSNTKGIGYVTDNLGNMPSGAITLGYSEGNASRIAIQEIPASTFGSKYIMIAINALSYNALTADGKLLYENAIRYVKSCITPTLSTVSQLAEVTLGNPATIELTGLVPNSKDNIILYAIEVEDKISQVINVDANASGNASFIILLNESDNGKELTITSIINGECISDFSGITTVLSVAPLVPDLEFGVANIVTYADGAPSSVLAENTEKGVKIEQIGTQGVEGEYIELNDGNSIPVLNSTTNDAILITSENEDIYKVVVNYAASSGTVQPYVGYTNEVTTMGSSSVDIASCTQEPAVGEANTDVTYYAPVNTKSMMMVVGKACGENTADEGFCEVANIQVFLRSASSSYYPYPYYYPCPYINAPAKPWYVTVWHGSSDPYTCPDEDVVFEMESFAHTPKTIEMTYRNVGAVLQYITLDPPLVSNQVTISGTIPPVLYDRQDFKIYATYNGIGLDPNLTFSLKVGVVDYSLIPPAKVYYTYNRKFRLKFPNCENKLEFYVTKNYLGNDAVTYNPSRGYEGCFNKIMELIKEIKNRCSSLQTANIHFVAPGLVNIPDDRSFHLDEAFAGLNNITINMFKDSSTPQGFQTTLQQILTIKKLTNVNLTISNLEFRNNKLDAYPVGIIFNDVLSNSNISIHHCEFYNFYRTIQFYHGSDPATDCMVSFTDNKIEKTWVGIDYNSGLVNNANIKVERNRFIDNVTSIACIPFEKAASISYINTNDLGYTPINAGNTYEGRSNYAIYLHNGTFIGQCFNAPVLLVNGSISNYNAVVRDCQILASNPIQVGNREMIQVNKANVAGGGNLIVEYSFPTIRDQELNASEANNQGYVVDFYLSNAAGHLVRYLGHSIHYTKGGDYETIIPNSGISSGSYIAATYTHLGDAFYPQLGTSAAATIAVKGCDCTKTILSLSPTPGERYILSGWVKESEVPDKATYENAYIDVSFGAGLPTLGATIASGAIIDGWQRIEKEFPIPENATSIQLILGNKSGASGDAYFDDVRLQPVDASMRTFVYDPVTLKLVAELDERNYATFYEYDEEQNLVRVKKETERGRKTIQESFTHIKKRTK